MAVPPKLLSVKDRGNGTFETVWRTVKGKRVRRVVPADSFDEATLTRIHALLTHTPRRP